MASITLQNIVKEYGSGAKAVPVIHNLNAQINDGEFVVIVGPSGCGKSTLLRMVAGLEEITGGNISIGDRVVNELEPAERDIAMVFQNYALYPHMSVFDNMAYGLKIAKVPLDDIKTRVDKAAGILELSHLLQRKPRELSGGQRQRVAMGRAIVRQPQVFLFDEPLSNLDAKLRNHMRIEIARLHQNLKTTTIYVTHDQHEAMTLADRIVLLKDGLIEQIGTPREIFERPRTKYVAGFIGTPPMNLMDMAVKDRDDHFEISGPSGMVTVSAHRFDLRGRDRVTLGVRPSHMSLSAPNEKGTGFNGNVELVEYLGNEVLVNLDCGGIEMGAMVPSNVAPQLQDRMTFSVQEEHLHMFDISTGQTLVKARA